MICESACACGSGLTPARCQATMYATMYAALPLSQYGTVPLCHYATMYATMYAKPLCMQHPFPLWPWQTPESRVQTVELYTTACTQQHVHNAMHVAFEARMLHETRRVHSFRALTKAEVETGELRKKAWQALNATFRQKCSCNLPHASFQSFGKGRGGDRGAAQEGMAGPGGVRPAAGGQEAEEGRGGVEEAQRGMLKECEEVGKEGQGGG